MTTIANQTPQRLHSCGGTYETVTESTTVELRGTPVTVNQTRFRCDACGEERMTRSQVEDFETLLYRTFEAMPNRRLIPREIREMREELGLTQAQLETALGIGSKTVVRWESGKVVQSQTTDDVLRLIRRDPSALAYLAEIHGADVDLSGSTPSGEAQERALRTLFPDSLVAELEALASADHVDTRTFLVMVVSKLVVSQDVNHHIAALVRDTWDPSSSEWEPWKGERAQDAWNEGRRFNFIA